MYWGYNSSYIIRKYATKDKVTSYVYNTIICVSVSMILKCLHLSVEFSVPVNVIKHSYCSYRYFTNNLTIRIKFLLTLLHADRGANHYALRFLIILSSNSFILLILLPKLFLIKISLLCTYVRILNSHIYILLAN